MNITEFRQKYPQYNDINDVDLSQSLHAKYYSDMPFPVFADRFMGQQQISVPGAPIQPQSPITDQMLIEELREKLPGEPKEQKPFPVSVSAEPSIIEQRRQQAYDELINRGFDPEQIKMGLQIQRQLKPTFWKEFQPTIGRTAGGIAGGIVGPLTLGQIPPFTALPEELITVPLTAALMAGAGGAAGQAAQIGIEERRIPAWRELLVAGGKEAGFEFGGRYAAMGLKAAFSPFIKKTLPEATEFIQRFGDNAVQFSPAEMDKRITIRAMEAISRGSFGADDIWREFGERQMNQMRTLAYQVSDTLLQGAERLGPQEITDLFAKGILEPDGLILKWVDDLFEPLYRQIDELAKGAKVSTSPLKQLARQELARDARMMKEGKRGLYLTPQARNMLKSIEGLKDDVSFGDMKALRSRFLASSRKLARDLDESQAVAKRISGKASEALYDPKYAQDMPQSARNLWQNTNNLYRETEEVLEKTFPERMAKSILNKPASATARIFPNKNPKAIAEMRDTLLGEGKITRKAKPLLKKVKPFESQALSAPPKNEAQALWNQLRWSWYEDVLDKATKEGGFSQTAYFNALHKMGDDALSEMFNAEELKNIWAIHSGLKMMNRVSAQGTPLFTKGVQIGGMYQIYQGAKKGSLITLLSGGSLAIGPVAFAKLATHPVGSKLLTVGLNLKPGSSELIPTITRMVNILRKMDEDEQKALLETFRRRKGQGPVYQPPTGYYRGFGGRGV